MVIKFKTSDFENTNALKTKLTQITLNFYKLINPKITLEYFKKYIDIDQIQVLSKFNCG